MGPLQKVDALKTVKNRMHIDWRVPWGNYQGDGVFWIPIQDQEIRKARASEYRPPL